MAIVIPEGFSQLNVQMALQGSTQTAECTFGFNDDQAASITTVLDAWGTGIMPRISNQYTYVRGQGRIAGGVLVEKLYAVVGGQAQAMAPPQVSGLVRKVTAIPGRAHKGRMYLPGILEGDIAPTGLLNTTYKNDTNAALLGFLASISSAPSGGFGLMVILHNPSSPQLPPTHVEQLVLQDLVATQRRRLRG